MSVNLNTTVGAILLGNVAAAISYGITCLQTHQYLSNSRDGRAMRGLIPFLWVVDTLHLIFITIFVYHFAVINFGNTSALLELTWSGHAHLVLTSVSDLLVRSIFIYRVTSFVKSKPLAVILGICALATFSGGIVFAAASAHFGYVPKLHKLLWVMDLSYGAAVAVDIVLTVSLCISLAQYRRFSHHGTDRVLRVLMKYTINTGALVGICTIAEMVAYATMPDNFVYQGIYFVLPTLYLNSLLATLNARDNLREYSTASVNLGIPMAANRTSTHSVTQAAVPVPPFRPTRPPIQVKVDTIYEIHSESGGSVHGSIEKV